MRESETLCVKKVYEGYHEWHVWRKSLRDFVPLLFCGAETVEETASACCMERRLDEKQLSVQSMEEQMLFLIRYTGRSGLKRMRRGDRQGNIQRPYRA